MPDAAGSSSQRKDLQENNMELEPVQLKISPMSKTWILDLDGTLLVHDGPYILGKDEFLPGAREFLDSIPRGDMIIFLTARSDYEKPHTMKFLKDNNVRYDHIIFNAGEGERIMINDMKPDGLVTAYAVNTERNRFCRTAFITDKTMGTRFD